MTKSSSKVVQSKTFKCDEKPIRKPYEMPSDEKPILKPYEMPSDEVLKKGAIEVGFYFEKMPSGQFSRRKEFVGIL